MRTKVWVASLISLVALAMMATAGCRGGSAADNYPNKQVTYLLVFDPGGQSDRAARMQQPMLEKALGQKVTIDYKVGGGGATGWSELVRGKPDGYTIAGINLPTIVAQPLQSDVGYKTEQILPISMFHVTPLALAVPSSSPIKTLQQFVDTNKGKAKVNVGGVTMFSATHLMTMAIAKDYGLNLEFIPFTGSAPMVTAFLGGHLDAMIGYSDDLTKYKEEARGLAFATKERFFALPDVPTFKELGKNYEFGIERGVGVVAGTPDPIVKKLEKVFMDVAVDPGLMDAEKKDGMLPLARTSAETQELIKQQTVLMKDALAAVQKNPPATPTK